MNIDELLSNIELNRLVSDNRFVLLVIVILALWTINKITVKVAQNKISNVQLLYHFKKTLNYIFIIIGVILIGVIWSEGVRSIPTFFRFGFCRSCNSLKGSCSEYSSMVFHYMEKTV